MNKRRLLKLADLLEADAKNRNGIKFDLAVWAAPSESAESIFEDEFSVVPVSCETTACAVGLACISGAFKRSGLTYELTPGYDGGFRLVPLFEGHTEFYAVTEFFGITSAELSFLFVDDAYPEGKTTGAKGERYVAKRIRDFVAGKVAPEAWPPPRHPA